MSVKNRRTKTKTKNRSKTLKRLTESLCKTFAQFFSLVTNVFAFVGVCAWAFGFYVFVIVVVVVVVFLCLLQ